MRVLFFTQYFAPEVGATQARTADMAEALVAAGHEVTLICEVPNHPAGEIWPAYRGKLFTRERLNGVDIIRVWVKTSPKKTYAKRLSFYTSYMMMAAAAGLLLARKRYDVVFATSPPLFVGASGLCVTTLRRLPFVFEVRDPWPEAAVALGELKEGPALRLARWLERRCYRRAAKVITVSDRWERHICDHGAAADRVVQIRNGANTALFHPQQAAGEALKARLGLPADGFVVLYAGLHGLAQELGTVVEAAARLCGDAHIRFVFAGEGPTKGRLVEQSRQLGLDNVLFIDPVPRDEAAALFSMADVAVVPLKRVPFLSGMIPAKAYDAWACGTPLLAAAEGELVELVTQADGGVTVAPEDGDALADAVSYLAQAPERCRQMGENGQHFVTAHYNRRTQAQAFVDLLESVV